jgi:hypothetical protein
MTPAELAEAVARATRDLAERTKARAPRKKVQRPVTNDDNLGGVFD